MLQVVCVIHVFIVKEKNLCFRDTSKCWKWGGASLHAYKHQIFKSVLVMGPEVFGNYRLQTLHTNRPPEIRILSTFPLVAQKV